MFIEAFLTPDLEAIYSRPQRQAFEFHFIMVELNLHLNLSTTLLSFIRHGVSERSACSGLHHSGFGQGIIEDSRLGIGQVTSKLTLAHHITAADSCGNSSGFPFILFSLKHNHLART